MSESIKATNTKARARRELLTDDEAMEQPLNTHYLMRAFAYLKPYKKKVLIALVALVISSISGLAGPKLMQIALDDYINVGVFEGLIWVALALLATSALSAYMLRIKIVYMNITGRQAIADMRDELFIHIQNLSFDFFDNRSAGKIMIRVINDINSLLNLFTQGIVNVITDVISLVVIVILMLSLDVRLSLVAFCAVPFIVVLVFVVKPHMQRAWRNVRHKSSSLNAYLHESLAGIRVTQAFVRENENAAIFRDVNKSLYKTWMIACFFGAIFWPSFMIVQTVGNCAIYIYGIRWINQELITMGTLFAMTWYLGRFWDPLNQLSNIYNQLLVAMASLERIFEILDHPITVNNKEQAGELGAIEGDVEFKDVVFGYDYEAGQRVLNGVSFHAKPGMTIALVGPTGAGKSTVVNLVNRFYDTNEGEVLIDGTNVKDVTLRSLRSQIGVMLQDSFIFSGTIMDNIRYGRLNATDEEVIEAAKAVHAHEFIMQMEKGYDTEVNERGSRLSTGQKQLISFARTLLADPRILILDEATASIDTHTEILIQQAIETVLKGRTSFVIAHRLSTIRKADCIMVVDNGTIMEAGNHDELMAAQGIYYNLCRAQYSFMATV